MRRRLMVFVAVAALAMGVFAPVASAQTIAGTTEVVSTDNNNYRYWHFCRTPVNRGVEYNVCVSLHYSVSWDRDVAWDRAAVYVWERTQIECVNYKTGAHINCNMHERSRYIVGGHGTNLDRTIEWGCGTLGIHTCGNFNGPVVTSIQDNNIWDESNAGHQCINTRAIVNQLHYGTDGYIFDVNAIDSGDRQLCTST